MPSVAISDVTSALRYAFRVGIGQNKPDVYREAVNFANNVTKEFRENDYNNYTSKFGSGRIKDIIGVLESSAQITFEQLMTDPTISIEERLAIWAGVDKLERGLRPRVYDRIASRLQVQYEMHPLSKLRTFEVAFPEPPGLDAWRQKLANEANAARGEAENNNPSNTIDRK